MDAQKYINSIPIVTYPLGNKELTKLLNLLNFTFEDVKFIHVAGTNGKGSFAAMMNEILIKNAYKTGLFTSPHLVKFNERIKVNNIEISDSQLDEITNELKNIVKNNNITISQFAFIFVCALVHFKRSGCEFVILETGLGGKYDATNVFDNIFLSVIMSIGMDHCQYLGETIEEIAAQKAGIIKNNSIVVAYNNQDSVNDIIKKKAKEKNSELYFASIGKKYKDGAIIDSDYFELSLKGDFQIKNLGVVLKTVDVLKRKGLHLDEEKVKEALSSCKWKARFQKINDNLIIDCAHNPPAVEALLGSLKDIQGFKTAVIAMMQDKDIAACIKMVEENFDKVIITQLDMPRCEKAKELYCKFSNKNNIEIYENTTKAFERIQKDEHGIKVIFGSIYLAGAALEYFKQP